MCCYGIWRKYGRRFPGRKEAEETSQVACLLKKKKARHRFPSAAFPSSRNVPFPWEVKQGPNSCTSGVQCFQNIKLDSASSQEAQPDCRRWLDTGKPVEGQIRVSGQILPSLQGSSEAAVGLVCYCQPNASESNPEASVSYLGGQT